MPRSQRVFKKRKTVPPRRKSSRVELPTSASTVTPEPSASKPPLVGARQEFCAFEQIINRLLVVERADMNALFPGTLMVKTEPEMAVHDAENEELIIPDTTHSFMEGPAAIIKKEPSETGNDCEILENPYQCFTCGANCESQQDLITHYETKCWTHTTVSEETTEGNYVKTEETEVDPLIGDEAPSDGRVQNIGHAFEESEGVGSHQLLFYCSFCGVASSEKQELMVHMESHVDVTYLSCAHCVHVYSDRYHLKNYKCRDESEKPHVCVHCSFRSQWWQELKDHCFSHHHRDLGPPQNLDSVGSLGDPATTISNNYLSGNPPSLTVSVNDNSNLQNPQIFPQNTNKESFFVVLKNFEPNNHLTGTSNYGSTDLKASSNNTSTSGTAPSSNNEEYLKHMLVSNSVSAVTAPVLQSPKYIYATSMTSSKRKTPPLVPVNAIVQNPTPQQTTPDQSFAPVKKETQTISDGVQMSVAVPSWPTNVRIIVPRPPEVAGPQNLPTVIPRDVSLNPLLKPPQAATQKPLPIANPKKKVSTVENMRKNKKIPCPYCDYLSRDKWNLRTHVLTHTKEKPFVCQLCPYRASQAAHLRKHMKTHVYGRKAMVK